MVTSQRKDEVEALYNAAVANERACYEQYQMARDGARIQDKESARSLVAAAQGTVNEVEAVSYTHLDVYKRQRLYLAR